MSALNLQALQFNSSYIFEKVQAQASAPTAASTSTPSYAQSLYSATEQLWISMEVLGHMLMNPPQPAGLNLEIAYTLFAQSVCNWESAYDSFIEAGGQPDTVTEAINDALNQPLPDSGSNSYPPGSTIYSISQTVASNPAEWQELSAVPKSSVNSLFEDVDEWIDADGASGSEGFQPTFSMNVNLPIDIDYLYGFLQQAPSEWNDYDCLLWINALNSCFLQYPDQLGPICSCLNDLFNTPFFQYDGKNYSLEDIANYASTDPNGCFTTTQIQEAEDALNACWAVLNAYVTIAYDYINELS